MEAAWRGNVEQFAICYPEDESVLPKDFTILPYMERSVLDLATFKTKHRKLPLFVDMLDALYKNSDADYFIQTNADIGLMPHFYDAVRRIIETGYDAFCINKRCISSHYTDVKDLPLMYSELGVAHNGYDCFVFRRELYPDFKLGNVCMGTPWSETTLAASMLTYARNMVVFKNSHLTFHIGDRRSWMQLHDYRQHNTEEFCSVMLELIKAAPHILHHPVIQWLLAKLRLEIQPHYARQCHQINSFSSLLTLTG
jgi:hypothetical protein